MVNYHLVDQAAVGGKNIILKKLRNNLGRNELGDEIIKHREKLGELLIEGDHVDIVDFEHSQFYGPIKMFINLQPVTVQNSELRVGDLLGIGNAVTVEEYRQMGGEAYNITRLFKLEEYQPEDGGCISSDEEENENILDADTDSCPSRCSEARINDLDEIYNLNINSEKVTSNKVESPEDDDDATNSGPDFFEISDDDDMECRSPEQSDAGYKGDPYNSDSLDEILPDSFRRQREDQIPEENVIDLLSDEDEIFNEEEEEESGIGESSPDPRSDTKSPEGEDLLTIQSDLQNPQFQKVDLAEEYGIASCLTPPSSRGSSISHDENQEKAEIPKKKQKRNKLKRPSRDSHSENDSDDDDNRSNGSDKSSRKRPKYKKHEKTSSSDEQKTFDKERASLAEQPNASPRIDPYRYTSAAQQIARKALYTEPSESPYKSYKGHKAPPIIPKAAPPQKSAKPPPSIKQMEQSTKGRFGPQKCTKTIAQMREERAKRAALLQQKSGSTMPKVKMSEISRSDRLLQEMNTPSTSKQPPQEPQPGPSRL